jgi:3-methyladenine DNA glycosylase AlkD
MRRRSGAPTPPCSNSECSGRCRPGPSGQKNQALNEALLEHIEQELAAAPEKVQWNMNWCAAQIGIADERLRGRCIALGERLGLYRDYPVSKGCTSPYLPIWIGAVVGKRASE